MEFRILGPIEVQVGGQRLALGGPRQEKALAVLLVEANRPVTLDQLVDALWDGVPPATARRQAQNTISVLRGLLSGAGTHSTLASHGRGYLLTVPAGELDADLFRKHGDTARQAAAAQRLPEAIAQYQAALRLWRGPAMAGLASPAIAAAAARLDEERLIVLAEKLDLELQLGLAAAVVGELAELVSQYPLRERLVYLLMLALYRCGRQADALAAYAQVKVRLRDELGIDPGPELTELRAAMLRHDPALRAETPGHDPAVRTTAPRHHPAPRAGQVPATTPTSAPRAGPLPAGQPPVPRPAQSPPPVPRQLPAPVLHFTGRDGDLAELDSLLKQSQEEATAVVITAIGGMGGIGKTALAVRWAHRVRDQFPDGDLYIDLRGYHASGVPLPPQDVLATFLRALGVAADRIPPGLDERAALYRTLLARRRMLILLDNARSVEQVRPLLPGAPRCVVVVTSRSRLPGLVAREGAHRIVLDVLSPADAHQLLRDAVGDERVDAEPEAAAALAASCGLHPLALRVAAERIAASRHTRVADAVAELSDRQRRLDLLAPDEDDDSAVRTAFRWSYEALPAPAQALFRRLGLHNGPDISVPAAAALAGTGAREASRLLAGLAAAHLLEEHAPHRYRLHDLMQLYAHEVTHREDDAAARLAAVRRLCGWYLHSAAAARAALSRSLPPVVPEPVELTCPPESFTGHADALAWCEAELANMVAAVTTAEEYGLHRIAWQLPTALYGFFDLRKYYGDWIATHTVALRCARLAGDREAEGRILCNIGNANWPMRDFSQAEANYRRAMEIFQEVGYRQGEAKVWGNLGITYDWLGRHDESSAAHHRALAIFRELGDRFGEALTMTNLGELLFRQQRYTEAAAYHRNALEVFRQLGDPHGEAEALSDLGNVLVRLGDPDGALAHAHRALELFRATGDRYEEAMVLAELGDILAELDDPARAQAHRREALALYQQIGDEEAAQAVLSKMAGAATP